MRLLTIGIFIFLIACSGAEQTQPEEENTTGIIKEIEPSKEETDALLMEGQPEIIQDFFNLEATLIGDDFCFDQAAIKDLVLHNSIAEDYWTSYSIGSNQTYLAFTNEECLVTTEFSTFYKGDTKCAFLSQMNQSIQQFDFLEWDPQDSVWIERDDFPFPKKTDFFEDLTPGEKKMVRDYGVYFIYFSNEGKNISLLFSDWAMHMNMGEKGMLDFDREPDCYFELNPTDSLFRLERKITEKDTIS